MPVCKRAEITAFCHLQSAAAVSIDARKWRTEMKNRLSLFAVILIFSLFAFILPVPDVYAAEAVFEAIPVQEAEKGVLLLVNGQKWYRVKGFEDNADYILTVRNEAGEQRMLSVSDGSVSQYIWNYSRTYMTSSLEPMIVSLSSGRYALSCRDGCLLPEYVYQDFARTWAHEESVLRYTAEGETLYLKYDGRDVQPFKMTADMADASEVILYSRAATLARCIIRQPAAESYVIEGSGYAAPFFSVGLAPDVITDSVRWFADGDEQPCSELTYSAEALTGLPAGVHSVYCVIEAHDRDGVHYCENSAEASFVICKGVQPDSFMTFSDVHEEYHLIGKAIASVIKKTDGYIPSLIICTGDLVNGPTAETDRELKRYFPQIISRLGGLDAVFVAGNHDSSEAASVMSAAAALGARKDLPAAGGVIFDGESDAVQQHGRNSRAAKGILTYGINFDAVRKDTAFGTVYTYENVIGEVDSFLKKAAESYHGELIVISAHSGLHLIGMQPESVNYYDAQLMEWTGGNHYNLDMSFELAHIINRYAEEYDMDILFLFGHNHSRGEEEMLLTEGSRLISPKCCSEQRFDAQTLHFTYANAGYLSTVIGSASARFSFISREGDHLSYDLLSASGGSIRHADINIRHPYEEPVSAAEVTAAAETSLQTVTESTGSLVPEESTVPSGQIAGPDAGGGRDHTALIAGAAFAVLLLSGRRHRTVDRQ